MRFSLLLCFLVSCGGPARIQIESNPEGALVTLNGVEKGRTPMVVQEKFRGTADLLLELEGYEPHRSALDLRPKWFEVPPFDLIPAKDRSFQIEMEIEPDLTLKESSSRISTVKISRNWYRLLAIAIVAFMVYDRASKEERLGRLTNAIQCLIEQNGDGARCPQISIDPYLQKGIQNKIVKEFNQTETTISVSPQDGNFEVQIQTTKSAGIVLGVTLRSTSEYQVVAWRDLELGEES